MCNQRAPRASASVHAAHSEARDSDNNPGLLDVRDKPSVTRASSQVHRRLRHLLFSSEGTRPGSVNRDVPCCWEAQGEAT